MTQMLLQEPGWKYERKGSALFLRRDSEQLPSKTSRVCFRCDVEVREYERDDDYYYDLSSNTSLAQQQNRHDSTAFGNSLDLAASPLAMCASCLAALAVTVVLPWLLIGG